MRLLQIEAWICFSAASGRQVCMNRANIVWVKCLCSVAFLGYGFCSIIRSPAWKGTVRNLCVCVARLWDYCGNKEVKVPLHVDMVLVDEKVQF
jgi:hypothetical protein